MAKRKSKQSTASPQGTDRSNLGSQPQSIPVNFPPEQNDAEGRFEKFVNRHHSLCFCIVMACEQRGRVAFGGEYLILPAAILARLWIPEMIQSVTGVLEMPDEEEEDV